LLHEEERVVDGAHIDELRLRDDPAAEARLSRHRCDERTIRYSMAAADAISAPRDSLTPMPATQSAAASAAAARAGAERSANAATAAQSRGSSSAAPKWLWSIGCCASTINIGWPVAYSTIA
jgi:hypothetical protein